MAWTQTTENGVLYAREETVTLPASAITEYSSEIVFLDGALSLGAYMEIALTASAVTGTNLDISLYGSFTSGGTKTQLLDAIVADLTDNTLTFGSVALYQYPMPYYYIGWLADVDESANNISVYLSVPYATPV